MSASLTPPPRPTGEGSSSNGEGSRVDLNGSTRAYILQVKEELERCMDVVDMSKEQMFQKLREKGIHPWIAFAVYKELHDQNREFFRKYHNKIELKNQEKRTKMTQQCQIALGGAAAGTGAPGTAAAPGVMAIPDVNLGLPEQQIEPAGLYNGICLVNSISGGHQFAISVNQLHAVAAQLLRLKEQLGFNGGVQVPLPACTYNQTSAYNGAMYGKYVSYPQSRTDSFGVSWHSQQAPPLQQWSSGAGAVAPPDSYLQPPSSVEMLQGNSDRRYHDASLHFAQAQHLQQYLPGAGSRPVPPPPGSCLQTRSSVEQAEHLQEGGPGWQSSTPTYDHDPSQG